MTGRIFYTASVIILFLSSASAQTKDTLNPAQLILKPTIVGPMQCPPKAGPNSACWSAQYPSSGSSYTGTDRNNAIDNIAVTMGNWLSANGFYVYSAGEVDALINGLKTDIEAHDKELIQQVHDQLLKELQSGK